MKKGIAICVAMVVAITGLSAVYLHDEYSPIEVERLDVNIEQDEKGRR